MGTKCVGGGLKLQQKQQSLDIKKEEKVLQQKKCISLNEDRILELQKEVSKGLEKGFLLKQYSIEEINKLKKQISKGQLNYNELLSLSKQISTASTVESAQSNHNSDQKKQLSDKKLQNKKQLHDLNEKKHQQQNISDFDHNVCCDDFYVIETLGKGAFGRVYLIKYRKNQQLYALKIVNKSDVLLYNMTENILLEKQILLQNKLTHSQFLLQLEASFQNLTKLFLITEYLHGGDLFSLVQNKKNLSENIVKFYLAEIVVALNEIHERRIIYRDIKPENILLQTDGHIKLADFGLCKQLKEGEEKTYSICGTAEYQAPEVILKKGYDKNVDYYALGILTYELLYGIPPFYDQERDPYKIQNMILKNHIHFYNKNISNHCKSFILQCTSSDIQQRLGSQGISQIYNHPFFQEINWKKLANHLYEPPFKIETKIKNLDSKVKFNDDTNLTRSFPRIVGFSFNNSFANFSKYQDQN